MKKKSLFYFPSHWVQQKSMNTYNATLKYLHIFINYLLKYTLLKYYPLVLTYIQFSGKLCFQPYSLCGTGTCKAETEASYLGTGAWFPSCEMQTHQRCVPVSLGWPGWWGLCEQPVRTGVRSSPHEGGWRRGAATGAEPPRAVGSSGTWRKAGLGYSGTSTNGHPCTQATGSLPRLQKAGCTALDWPPSWGKWTRWRLETPSPQWNQGHNLPPEVFLLVALHLWELITSWFSEINIFPKTTGIKFYTHVFLFLFSNMFHYI